MALIAVVSFAAAAMQRLAGAASQLAAWSMPAPRTALGRDIEDLLVMLRYALIAVPIAIVAAEVRRARRKGEAVAIRTAAVCGACGVGGHAAGATYCRRCGEPLTSVVNDLFP